MTQIKTLPRKVGFSLLKSLNFCASRLSEAYKNSDGAVDDGTIRSTMRVQNKNLFLSTDLAAFEQIKEFHESLQKRMRNEKPMPLGSFISVAKHNTPDMKYVITDTSCGIVVTTGMLKRILSLMCNVGSDVKYEGRKEVGVRYAIEYSHYYDDALPSLHFLRLLDLISYFSEIQSNLVEISLEKYAIDNKMYDAVSGRQSYYNDRNSGVEALPMFPMLSDRYQEESWRHYLQTTYMGLTEINIATPHLTPINKSIALGELQRSVGK